MALAVASARDENGEPRYSVVGVDLPTTEGLARIQALNSNRFPYACSDKKIAAALAQADGARNLVATDDPESYSRASIVVVDVHLDILGLGTEAPHVDLSGIVEAVRTVAQRIPAGGLILVETTVPPGTCDRVLAPMLSDLAKARGLPSDAIQLAHSYERVMPGDEYYDSIVNYWRVYAGHTQDAAETCEAFLSGVVNVQDFPLRRLKSMTASETAKVLENSYRAATIAFAEEWGRFAEAVGVDLFEVIDAIRVRPTHSNMRQPGFGVGGYCLTKDPLLAGIGARELFGRDDLSFPFSTRAVDINRRMPLVTLGLVERTLGQPISGKRILLLGVSYRRDVGDTRNSPSQTFVEAARQKGASVICSDPLVGFWPELSIEVTREIPPPAGFDAVVFAVDHPQYADLDLAAWLDADRPAVIDANNVLSPSQRAQAELIGCRIASIGRGDRT